MQIANLSPPCAKCNTRKNVITTAVTRTNGQVFLMMHNYCPKCGTDVWDSWSIDQFMEFALLTFPTKPKKVSVYDFFKNLDPDSPFN